MHAVSCETVFVIRQTHSRILLCTPKIELSKSHSLSDRSDGQIVKIKQSSLTNTLKIDENDGTINQWAFDTFLLLCVITGCCSVFSLAPFCEQTAWAIVPWNAKALIPALYVFELIAELTFCLGIDSVCWDMFNSCTFIISCITNLFSDRRCKIGACAYWEITFWILNTPRDPAAGSECPATDFEAWRTIWTPQGIALRMWSED